MAISFRWPIKITNPLKAEVSDLKRELGELRAGINTPGGDNLMKYLYPDEYNGDSVSTTQALNLSSVYAALNILCNSLNVPINVYKRTNGKREIVTQADPWEYSVHFTLHTSPNVMMTPSEWIGLMETSRWLRGNAYSRILFNKSGFIAAYRWLHPDQVTVKTDDKEIFYDLYDRYGKLIEENVPAYKMIHIKALSTDGITGMSPIDLAAKSLKFGIETQNAGNKFFKSGMKSSIVLSHPGILEGAGQKNLKESFEKQMDAGKTIVLEEGLKPYVLTVSPEQAEFMASRKFSVTEVARWFNIPEHMLANNDPTYSNIEQQSLSFITHNVRPRARQYEQEFNWKLLGNDPNFFTEFNMNALLRADIKTRFDVYSLARQNGIMSANECRELENMNPREGGDNYDNPNITPGGSDPNN